jgi:gluconolactonase
MNRRRQGILPIIAVIAAAGIVFFSGCASEPPWMKTSRALMKKNGITLRTRADIPKTGIVSNLEPGKTAALASLPETELAPGVKARLTWSSGVMTAAVTLAPNAEYPEETLPAERIMVVMKGAVNQRIGEGMVPMIAVPAERMTPVSGHREQNDFIVLEKGAKNALKAGPDGAEIIEVYSPPRLDWLAKAGVKNLPSQVSEKSFGIPATIEPGVIGNLHEVQFAPLSSGAMFRLVAGKNAQLCVVRIDPDSTVAPGAAPEESIRLVLRGEGTVTLLDSTAAVVKDSVFAVPGGMVNGAAAGKKGLDILDVVWPPRADLADIAKKQTDRFHELVPADAKIELVVDAAKTGPGLCYGEGPAWINGKLYFSNMAYDAKWTGDPKASATVEMDPDGAYRYIARGIETNGIFPMKNGNFAVCDMYGHRVIEMNVKGKVVRTIADKYDGKRIDGPNDVCVDTKGGVYFTDPQILPKPFMQPGKSVF